MSALHGPIGDRLAAYVTPMDKYADLLSMLANFKAVRVTHKIAERFGKQRRKEADLIHSTDHSSLYCDLKRDLRIKRD